MELTALDALREIQAQLSKQPDAVPEGWMTDAQWAQACNLGRTTVGHTLRTGVEAGLVECKVFRVITSAGVRPMKHYRKK